MREGFILNGILPGLAGVGGLKPCLRAWKPCGLCRARQGFHELREGFIPNGYCGVNKGFECLYRYFENFRKS
jgi:hypothetical protein